ncbi:hypothetical protein EPO15_09575, partial [bacterium]
MRVTGMTGRRRSVGRLCLLAATLLGAPALRAAEPGIAIVGFGDYLWLRVDGRTVALEPGSAAYEIPSGARTVVSQGAATLLARDALLRVDAGDDFSVSPVDGQLRLLVNSGAVEVSVPGRPVVMVAAGRFAALTGPEAGTLPGTAAVMPPAVPVAAIPTAPVTPPPAPEPPPPPSGEWDPLAALASGFNRLSSLRSPELKLVLELHPFYRITETYDTNIYLVPKERAGAARVGGGVVGSWITVNELGTTWKLPMSKSSTLRGNYSARASNYSSQGRTNNAVDQTVSGGYDYTGRKGVLASLTDTYVNTEDPAFSEQVARQRRMSNEIAGSLDVEHSRRLFTRLNGRHQISKYLDPTLARSLNRYEAAVGADFGVRVAPKTRVYVSYVRELTHYSAGRADNSTSHRIGLGVNGRLTSKLAGRVQGDLHYRRYSGGSSNLKRTTTNFLAAVDLTYKATRRLDGRFGLWRALQETTFGANRYYIATGARLGLTQTFRKWALSADGSFETSRYPESSGGGGVFGNRR